MAMGNIAMGNMAMGNEPRGQFGNKVRLKVENRMQFEKSSIRNPAGCDSQLN